MGSMDGKLCVITGATSGIGKAMAVELAERGARLAIVARNPSKADATIADIERSAPSARIDVVIADLALLADVRKAAAELHDRYDRIDVLLNNAGINPPAPTATSEGYDALIATNYLAPFLLTNLVLDQLQAAAPSRMVLTGSEAHRFATPIDLDTLGASPQRRSNPISAQLAYGTSKLMAMLFTRELARRLDGVAVTSNSFCPGLVATNLAGDSTFTRIAKRLSGTPLVRRPEQGARMGVRLATDPELTTINGQFFTSTPAAKVLPERRMLGDVDLQRRLWDRTSTLVGLDATEEPPPTLAR